MQMNNRALNAVVYLSEILNLQPVPYTSHAVRNITYNFPR